MHMVHSKLFRSEPELAAAVANSQFGFPVQCLPARRGQQEVVQLLLERGADPMASTHVSLPCGRRLRT